MALSEQFLSTLDRLGGFTFCYKSMIKYKFILFNHLRSANFIQRFFPQSFIVLYFSKFSMYENLFNIIKYQILNKESNMLFFVHGLKCDSILLFS